MPYNTPFDARRVASWLPPPGGLTVPPGMSNAHTCRNRDTLVASISVSGLWRFSPGSRP
jgi:hypothetical protein